LAGQTGFFVPIIVLRGPMMRAGKTRCAPAAAAVTLIAACSGGGTSGNATGNDVVTITLTSDAAPVNAKATQQVITLFERSHPKIKVKFEPDNGTARQSSVLRIGQGDPSLDIASAEVGYQYQWYANGWITPVTKYFTKAELSTVVPHLIEEWTTSDGKMLGIPTDNSGMWLAVNQDLLKQAGVKPPPTMKRESLQATTSGVWTWEQVLAAAKQVKQKTGKTGLIFPGDQAWATLPLAEQLGAKATGPRGLTVDGYLNKQPWVEAMARWKTFFVGGASQIANPNFSNDQFLAGNAAFQLSHDAVFDECKTVKFDCDAAAQPYYQGGHKAVQSTNSGYVLNAKSPHQAQAAEFMKFVLLNPQASKILVAAPFFAGVPMLKTPFAAMMTDPKYKTFPNSVKVLGAWQSQNWPETPVKSPIGATLFTSLSDAYQSARTGAKSPQDAATTMYDQVSRELTKYH